MEVIIIVFAVSLSIWLHGWAEGLKDKKEEREFVVGLKQDLQEDIKEMRADLAWYEKAKLGLQYFERVAGGEPLQKDSFASFQWVLFSFAQIEPRSSRFEALKSSGKMNIIEDKELQLAITDVYTKLFPHIRRLNDYLNSLKDNRIMPFISGRIKVDAPGMGANWQEILREPAMRLMLGAESLDNVVGAYREGIQDCEKVIGLIDKELK